MALSRSVTISIPSLRNFDFNAIRFYDRAHRVYDAAIFTRCYNQHALLPHIRDLSKFYLSTRGLNLLTFPGIFKNSK